MLFSKTFFAFYLNGFTTKKRRGKRLVQSACQSKNDTVRIYRKTKKIYYSRTHTQQR